MIYEVVEKKLVQSLKCCINLYSRYLCTSSRDQKNERLRNIQRAGN